MSEIDNREELKEKWGFYPEIHPKLWFLIDCHKRYKAARGGRAGRKSYSFADACLARMVQKRTMVVIGREYETTIRDSVHRLLKNRIEYHGLHGCFNVARDSITCSNDSVLTYRYLHDNYSDVKGLEDVDIFWIFEAEKWTRDSYNFIYPTIRKQGSEIWVEFNPENDDDFVMDKFVYHIDNSDTISTELTYLENEFLSEESRLEAEKCKRDNPDEYEHIWLGHPSRVGSKIYPMFDPKVHVRDYDLDSPTIRENAMFFCGQDPATVYYPFQVWMMRIYKSDKEFDYVVYNEFPTLRMMGGKYFWEYRDTKPCDLTLSERAKIFKVIDNTIDKRYDYIKIKARGIDTRFAKASGAASTTLGGTRGMIIEMSDPRNGGLTFQTPPERIIDVQRDILKGLLRYDTDLGYISGFNEPHFYVMPHCHNVIDALTHHRIDNQKKSEDPKRKDPIDAIRITLATMEGYSHDVRKMRWEEKAQAEIDSRDAARSNADILREVWLQNEN